MTRGTIRPTTRAEAVERARAMIDFHGVPLGSPLNQATAQVHYSEERGFDGTTSPLTPHCCSPSNDGRVWVADCVALVLWSVGIDRLQPDYRGVSGAWLHCPSMVADAHGARVYFQAIAQPEVLPGDILIDKGHTALIVEPDAAGHHLAIDCSPFHGWTASVGWRRPWSPHCEVIRYLHFAADPPS